MGPDTSQTTTKEQKQVKIPTKLCFQMLPPAAIMMGDHDTKEPGYQGCLLP